MSLKGLEGGGSGKTTYDSMGLGGRVDSEPLVVGREEQKQSGRHSERRHEHSFRLWEES